MQTPLTLARDTYRVAWHAQEDAEARGLDGLTEAAARVLAAAEADIERLELADTPAAAEALARLEGARLHLENVLNELQLVTGAVVDAHAVTADQCRRLANLLRELSHCRQVIRSEGAEVLP